MTFGIRRPPLVFLAAALVLAGASLAARQNQQQPTFRSGTKTVAVYATVSETGARLVPDLAREDFEILEDGKQRPISIFSNETQAITAVIMLDRSGSMRSGFPLVRAASEMFVRKLLPGDKVRIGTFSSKITIEPEDFTSTQDELVRILRTQERPEGPTPLWNAVDEAMAALSQQSGRRVVIVFTDGADSPGNFRTNNLTLMDVMDRGQREDIMVYAIGLEGRLPPMGGGSGGMRPGGGLMGGFGGGMSSLGVQRPDPGLPTISGETGGGYFELTNGADLGATFSRVADELHHQYALGFEPSKLDGKTHKLQVKVKKPGMKVRARKSYVAARE